ncbi:MAG: MgtC/SapB family protein [Actinomycetota bacterium]|nr:MgtC/SapB family protein [Actinomycetota bacterium]
MIDNWELIVRILAAAGLGAAVGLEREFSDQPAGFRTHILVSLGAALFTVAGALGAEAFDGDSTIRFDPTRIAAQVVTGIGFLGAGAIIQQGVNVRGLTTAASLWVTAAIGLACGLGFYAAALVTAGVTLVSLVLLKPLERGILQRVSIRRQRLIIQPEEGFRVRGLVERLDELSVSVGTFSLVTEDDDSYFVVSLKLPKGVRHDRVLEEVSAIEGIKGAAWYG